MNEILTANEGNQFWTKYLQPASAIEYKPISQDVEAALNKHESEDLRKQKEEIKKKEAELIKIKTLDMQLAVMAKEKRKKILQ